MSQKANARLGRPWFCFRHLDGEVIEAPKVLCIERDHGWQARRMHPLSLVGIGEVDVVFGL